MLNSPSSASSPPEIDSRLALERLLALLSVEGATGQENLVANHILRELRKLGIPDSAVAIDDSPLRIPVPCVTGNVIVKLDGSLPGPRRLLSAHMDTVPLARGAEPVVRDGRIYPRSATALGGDDRTGVAVLLTTLAELKRQGQPHGPLTFLFSVREESGLRGAAAVRVEDLGGPTLGFNFDGGLPEEVTIGATGAARLDITIRGVAAHAGVHPERGVSAVAILADAVGRLERGGWHGLIRKGASAGTSNIGVVQGGDATNVVTDLLRVQAEARSHDREFLERILNEYKESFHAAASEHRNEAGASGSADLNVELSYHAFKLSEDDASVQAAAAAVRRIGLAPRLRISNGGLDANWLAFKGIPTVTLGCGQHEIHTTSEFVVVDEYLAGCRLGLALTAGGAGLR